MQLTPTSPTATPATTVTGTITLGVWNADGDYWVRHRMDMVVDEAARSTTPTLAKGASIRDAIRAAADAAAASTTPAGSPLGRAYGVVQAADGALELQAYTFTLDGATYPVVIDGPTWDEWGVDEVTVDRNSDALLAVVGASSWIDLSAATRGMPRPLPA